MSPSRLVRLSGLPLALCFLFGCSEQRAEADPAPEPRAPHIDVVDLDGLESAVDAYRGKALLLNCWAIWCEPCVDELPELVEVAAEYSERGAAVVGVSYDLMLPGKTVANTLPALEKFVGERMPGIHVLLFDEIGQDGINELYDLPGPIPVTLAIDAAGDVVDRHEGVADRPRFEEMMERALAE